METKTAGQYIKEQRGAKDLSQRVLGKLIGVPQTTIARLELSTLTPSKSQWERLREHLDLPLELPTADGDRPEPSLSWRSRAPSLSAAGKVGFGARLPRAREGFPALWHRLWGLLKKRDNFPLIRRFLDDAGLDSSPELMYWTHILLGGGSPCWCAPLRVGFRKLCVVEGVQKQKAVGDLRRPSVEIVRDGYSVLMFPQVRVVTRFGMYVLDALVCVRRRGRRVWVNVEVDGGGHDPAYDAKRELHLGLATIRLTTADLAKEDMLETLERRLLELLERKSGKAS